MMSDLPECLKSLMAEQKKNIESISSSSNDSKLDTILPFRDGVRSAWDVLQKEGYHHKLAIAMLPAKHTTEEHLDVDCVICGIERKGEAEMYKDYHSIDNCPSVKEIEAKAERVVNRIVGFVSMDVNELRLKVAQAVTAYQMGVDDTMKKLKDVDLFRDLVKPETSRSNAGIQQNGGSVQVIADATVPSTPAEDAPKRSPDKPTS